MADIRILHIIPSFGLGGMEKIICSIINHTCEQYQHIILSLDGNNDAFQWIQSNNIQQVSFSKEKEFSQLLKKIYNEIKSVCPDLLMTYNWGATDAIWLGRLARVKGIIHHEHGFSIEEAQATVWKRDICRFIVYRMASALVTVSSNLKAQIQKKYWLAGKHIQMIPNGIDTNYYSPDAHVREQIRHELNLSREDFVVVFSGRLDPVKNFELLLEIFDLCHHLDTKVKLLIIGEGPERQKIEQIREQKNLHSDVVILGQKSEVLPYLRAGDAFLLTSLTEQMPLTILEAMSVGLPVVASNVGEIGKIIDDGQDGFLRDIEDGYAGFASALLGLKDSADLQTMSHAARSKIATRFQEVTMVQRYQRLIDDLLWQHRQC